jgi:hypothetical protein
MSTRNPSPRLVAIVFIAFILVACGGAEKRKAAYLVKGQQFY